MCFGGQTMDQWTIAAMMPMAAFFLALPILLACRMTPTSKKREIYLLAEVPALSAFMPAYAIYLGTVLLIACKISFRKAAGKRA